MVDILLYLNNFDFSKDDCLLHLFRIKFVHLPPLPKTFYQNSKTHNLFEMCRNNPARHTLVLLLVTKGANFICPFFIISWWYFVKYVYFCTAKILLILHMIRRVYW
jgi:hypothetical protein